MKVFKVQWTDFALQSLEQVYEYLLKESGSATLASRYVTRLIERTGQLSLHPNSGQKEPFLKAIGQDSRYILEGNYKIIYQVGEQVVIITDIFHTKQNPVKVSRGSKKK